MEGQESSGQKMRQPTVIHAAANLGRSVPSGNIEHELDPWGAAAFVK